VTVISDLNLRAGPSTRDVVLLALPTGDEANGVLSVSYRGTEGWAYGDRHAVPLTGRFAIRWMDCPDVGGSSQWAGTVFCP
jgi:uncharacterized protein YraI